MSAEDPRPEFWLLMEAIEAGTVSDKAVKWFDSAFEKMEAIMETVEYREARGQGLTDLQAAALANFHRAACNWLGREPSDDAPAGDMQVGG
jgi:hypothetical protein